MRPCAANKRVANRIKAGTRRSNTCGGVTRSSIAPATAPAMLGAISQYMRGAVCAISRRYPHTAPSEPGHTAAVLVAFAIIGGTPSQINVGKLTSDPPNAIALMALAMNPTKKMSESRTASDTWTTESFHDRSTGLARTEWSADIAGRLAGMNRLFHRTFNEAGVLRATERVEHQRSRQDGPNRVRDVLSG